MPGRSYVDVHKAIVGEETRCAVSHAVGQIIYVNEKQERAQYRALWYAGGDWDGLRLFPVQDYFLRSICQEGFDPRQGIATDSIVVEFQD